MFDSLVLSGGSYKGYSYIGVLRRLEESGIRPQIRNVSACSVGSIFGLFFTLGLASKTMMELIKKYDISKAYHFDLASFMSGYGFCDFSKIRAILIEVLSSRGISSSLTFSQLYQLSGGINLVINSTCLESCSASYFSHENSPEMEVLQAIQMSCAIPLIFVRVQHLGRTYVDGGILDNLPVTPFKDKDRSQVLSIYLTENVTDIDLHSLSGYLVYVVNLITNNFNSLREKLYYPDSYLVKISVPVNFMTLELSSQQISELVESGYQQTSYYFALWRAKYGYKYPNEVSLVSSKKFKIKIKPKPKKTTNKNNESKQRIKTTNLKSSCG